MGNKPPQKSPEEIAKENKRMLSRAIRTVEREQKKLQNQEVKLLKDIKALAQKNQHGPAKILSKDLVRTRNQVNQYYTMISQLKAIEMQLNTATINNNMVNALKGVNQVMGSVNETMDMAQIRQVMKEFAKESAKMEMQQEMMSDQMEMMNPDDMEQQADEIYGQILSEVGMKLNSEINTGSDPIAQPASAVSVSCTSLLMILVLGQCRC